MMRQRIQAENRPQEIGKVMVLVAYNTGIPKRGFTKQKIHNMAVLQQSNVNKTKSSKALVVVVAGLYL